MDRSTPSSAHPHVARQAGKPGDPSAVPDEWAAYVDWKQGLGHWLSGFHWQVYVTPTFRAPVCFAVAESCAHRWLRAIGPEVYAYVAYERGAAGGRSHIHALLGGLVPRGSNRSGGLRHLPLAIQRTVALWRYGYVKAEPYDPHRGAAFYVAKCPDSGELVGTLKRHRTRARRRPKRSEQQSKRIEQQGGRGG